MWMPQSRWKLYRNGRNYGRGISKGPLANHREPRNHCEGASTRGLSNEQVRVCVAIDWDSKVYTKCSNRAEPSSKDLIKPLGNHIAPQSVILKDGEGI